MATLAVTGASRADSAASASYERFAGACAILGGIAGLLYSVSFVILRSNLLSGLFLLIVGLLTTAIVVGVYARLRETDAFFALWALLLGLSGGIGSAIHGGYDLANAINPPPSLPDVPFAADPRGLATFGLVGLGLWVTAWLIVRGGQFPKSLGYLGYLLSALMIVLYLGRLIVLDATSPLILVPALLAGFLISPIWNIWLGATLWRGQRA